MKFLEILLCYFCLGFIVVVLVNTLNTSEQLTLLSDPFLQLPTPNSIRVVWFTEFAGDKHQVFYDNNLAKTSLATTTKLSKVAEDKNSQTSIQYTKNTPRDIWRHEAIINNLTPNQSVPYRVISYSQGQKIISDIFSLAPQPSVNTSLKILLTSDHQLMPLTAANLEKVVETIGKIDAVFLAGDLVNVPDRASEWFDTTKGNSFFSVLQGKANYHLIKEEKTTVYQGGKIIQSAPLFPAIGNHEVMGRFSRYKGLNYQFNDAFPRAKAEEIYRAIQPPVDKNTWLKNHSFNTDTYEEIFSLPNNSPGRKKYYAVSFGDIRLVVLYITNIWRKPDLDPTIKGRYQESIYDLPYPQKWGYGQHIFEPITPDSQQYNWFQQELASDEFKRAKYKIVMFHHPPHTLGGNIVPPYTDPIQIITYDGTGKITRITYEYPKAKDYIVRDVLPLIEKAQVDLVFYGHSHLWNRFLSPTGINFLESSNVGNTYGAHTAANPRPVPKNNPNYTAVGNPNGLEPIMPNISPLVDEAGNKLPYIASNDITVFSILDTAQGTVSSYRFDTRQPNSSVVKFDEFKLKNEK